jgi:hypothetical protein
MLTPISRSTPKCSAPRGRPAGCGAAGRRPIAGWPRTGWPPTPSPGRPTR